MYESLDSGEELNLMVEKSELLESDVGAAGGRVLSLKGSSFESEMAGAMSENLEHLRTIDELYEIHTSQQAELCMENLKNSEVLVSQTGTGDQVILSGDNSFVPQTPDRMSEILTNSPLTRRKTGHGGGQSLPRGGSMKVTNKHSSLNCKVLQEDPTNQEFISKLLKSQSTKGSFKSSSVRREEQECRGALGSFQRDGSMRKGKECKRTLACKLYEERMTFKLHEERDVDDGAEEMDFLWEAYEKDAIKSNNFKSKGKNGKGQVLHVGVEEDAQEEDEEEEGDETTTGGIFDILCKYVQCTYKPVNVWLTLSVEN